MVWLSATGRRRQEGMSNSKNLDASRPTRRVHPGIWIASGGQNRCRNVTD